MEEKCNRVIQSRYDKREKFPDSVWVRVLFGVLTCCMSPVTDVQNTRKNVT